MKLIRYFSYAYLVYYLLVASVVAASCDEFFAAIKNSSLSEVFYYSYDEQAKLGDCVNELKQNALHIFAEHCQLKEIFSSLRFLAKADLNAKDLNHQTPLIIAAKVGNLKAVYWFLSSHRAGIDINEQDNDGHSAIYYALLTRNTAMINIFLKFGAKIHRLDSIFYHEYDGNSSAKYMIN